MLELISLPVTHVMQVAQLILAIVLNFLLEPILEVTKVSSQL